MQSTMDLIMSKWRATTAKFRPSLSISKSFTFSAMAIIIHCHLGLVPAYEEERLEDIAKVENYTKVQHKYYKNFVIQFL